MPFLFFFVVLLFCCFVVLLFCCFVVLLFCCFVVLLFCCFVVLLFCCFVVLLFCCFVVLLFCCFVETRGDTWMERGRGRGREEGFFFKKILQKGSMEDNGDENDGLNGDVLERGLAGNTRRGH